MRFSLLIIWLLVTGCGATGDLHQSNGKPTVSDDEPRDKDRRAAEATNRPFDPAETKHKRRWFNDANWIDFSVKHSHATIENHVDVFRKSVTLQVSADSRLGDKGAFLKYCDELSIKKAHEITGIVGDVRFFVNPLNVEIARRLASQGEPQSVVIVTNPLIVKRVELTVNADFLSLPEKQMIENLWTLKELSIMDEVQAMFYNRLGGFRDMKPWTLSRLFCGIAKKEAYLRYKLIDANERSITVDINDVNFDGQNY